ncbi:hypothetical protein PAXINDRAFT_182050 [Paxillus involutus ATCC 200175]|uniref:Uncharacterized protein n=1 Tax=Paxillus involutus ATCC 200175 TaxID=664439 RepID=A0A0C9TR90_PAXIN|nr:hypothetical protein PAXINDRAFT_182050 [Paxillus involutus ATCC 200175]
MQTTKVNPRRSSNVRQILEDFRSGILVFTVGVPTKARLKYIAGDPKRWEDFKAIQSVRLANVNVVGTLILTATAAFLTTQPATSMVNWLVQTTYLALLAAVCLAGTAVGCGTFLLLMLIDARAETYRELCDGDNRVQRVQLMLVVALAACPSLLMFAAGFMIAVALASAVWFGNNTLAKLELAFTAVVMFVASTGRPPVHLLDRLQLEVSQSTVLALLPLTKIPRRFLLFSRDLRSLRNANLLSVFRLSLTVIDRSLLPLPVVAIPSQTAETDNCFCKVDLLMVQSGVVAQQGRRDQCGERLDAITRISSSGRTCQFLEFDYPFASRMAHSPEFSVCSVDCPSKTTIPGLVDHLAQPISVLFNETSEDFVNGEKSDAEKREEGSSMSPPHSHQCLNTLLRKSSTKQPQNQKLDSARCGGGGSAGMIGVELEANLNIEDGRESEMSLRASGSIAGSSSMDSGTDAYSEVGSSHKRTALASALSGLSEFETTEDSEANHKHLSDASRLTHNEEWRHAYVSGLSSPRFARWFFDTEISPILFASALKLILLSSKSRDIRDIRETTCADPDISSGTSKSLSHLENIDRQSSYWRYDETDGKQDKSIARRNLVDIEEVLILRTT